MGRKTTITKHLTQKEIKLLSKKNSNYKSSVKLLALMNLYNGKTMSETADFLMISYSNLKNFIKRWNRYGVEAINPLSQSIKSNNNK